MAEAHYERHGVRVHHGDCMDVMAAMDPDSVDAVVCDPPYALSFMGDCMDVMAAMDPDSVDAVVCDPPYALSFMGREWDRYAPAEFADWCQQWAAEALRVVKPGGHLIAFGATRTHHRLMQGVEDAGWEIRDCGVWAYRSGFPKSLDVGKAIDKQDAAEERTRRARAFQGWLKPLLTPQQVNEITGTDMGHHLTTHPTQPYVATPEMLDMLRPHVGEVPAHIEGIVANRVVVSEQYQSRPVTGEYSQVVTRRHAGVTAAKGRAERRDIAATSEAEQWDGWGTAPKPAIEMWVLARRPLSEGTIAANVLRWGTGAINVDGCRSPDDEYAANAVTQGVNTARTSWTPAVAPRTFAPSDAGRWPANVVTLDNDHDLRHFRANGGQWVDVPKASTNEKPWDGGDDDELHPTVKPLALMRHLVRLVTPPGGLVLDPFAGTGTTGEAAVLEGMQAVLIEREAAYLPLIKRRLAKPLQPSLIGDISP